MEVRRIDNISVCTAVKDTVGTCVKVLFQSVLDMDEVRKVSFHAGCWNESIRAELQGLINQAIKDVKSLPAVIDIFAVPEERKSGEYFNPATALNVGIDRSLDEYMLCCGADQILPKNFVELYMKNVSKRVAWFPVPYSLHEGKPAEISGNGKPNTGANGWWRYSSYGIIAMTKADLVKIGMLGEDFVNWGGGDNDIFVRAYEHCKKVNRDICPGLYHVWHPKDTTYHKTRNKRWGEVIRKSKEYAKALASQ